MEKEELQVSVAAAKNTAEKTDEKRKSNIYEKLSAISTELMTVAKNLEVGVGQSKYKAVGEADVLRAVKPLEAKHKVYSYPFKRTIVESGEIVSANAKGEGRKNLFIRLEVVYRFVNMEKPEEFVDITSYGDGIDTQDKSVGKAMTYADKYALLKAYKIVTGEDPDQEPSGELVESTIEKKKLDGELLKKAQALNINIQEVAVYFKKEISELTNEDLKTAIELQEKALAKVGAKR